MKEGKRSKFQDFSESRAIEAEKIKAEDALHEASTKLTETYVVEAMRLIQINFEYEAQADDLPLIYGLMKSMVESGFDPSMTDKIFTEAITLLNKLGLKNSNENKATAFCGAVLRILET